MGSVRGDGFYDCNGFYNSHGFYHRI